jgi:hypothetical protein
MDAEICKKGEMKIDSKCVNAKTWAERHLSNLRIYDDVYDELMKHNPKHSWHEEMVMYKEIWEHPTVKQINKSIGQRHILSHGVCSLYYSEYDKKYLFVIGRIGNTTNLIFEG